MRDTMQALTGRLTPTRWRVSDLLLDTKRQRLWRGSQEIPLPKLSYDLFVALVRRSSEVTSDEQLMEDVWPGLVVGPETVSQRVKLLREALGDDSRMPRYIGRLRGRGYHLVPTVEALGEEAADASPTAPRLMPPIERAAPTPDPDPEPVLDAITELTLLEPPCETQTLKEPDWASPPAIPRQLFEGLLETPAGGAAQGTVDPESAKNSSLAETDAPPRPAHRRSKSA